MLRLDLADFHWNKFRQRKRDAQLHLLKKIIFVNF